MVDHIKIESGKKFEEVRRALEETIPKLNPVVGEFLRKGDQERAKAEEEHGPKLSIFLDRDHGALLQIAGGARNARQYDIGNPLTASKMTRHQLSAALYAPLRVVLYEDGNGRGIFEYDKPSSFFGQLETKMSHVCVGDRAEAALMGYRDPIVGRVETVTRGISVSNAAPSTQGLPSVDPVYTWERLAQRVPVRIRITDVPAGVPLVSGMTATVTIRSTEAQERGGWLRQRFASLVDRLDDIVHGPQPSPGCVPRIGAGKGATVTLPTPKPTAPLSPAAIDPGLAPGMNKPPQAR